MRKPSLSEKGTYNINQIFMYIDERRKASKGLDTLDKICKDLRISKHRLIFFANLKGKEI